LKKSEKCFQSAEKPAETLSTRASIKEQGGGEAGEKRENAVREVGDKTAGDVCR